MEEVKVRVSAIHTFEYDPEDFHSKSQVRSMVRQMLKMDQSLEDVKVTNFDMEADNSSDDDNPDWHT